MSVTKEELKQEVAVIRRMVQASYHEASRDHAWTRRTRMIICSTLLNAVEELANDGDWFMIRTYIRQALLELGKRGQP